MSLWMCVSLTDDHYHLEYHRAMQEAYRRQNVEPLMQLQVHPEDFKTFLGICREKHMSVTACFHYLLNNNG